MAEQLLAGVARATSGLPEDHTALVFGDRRTSFTELDSRANKVANGLLSLGATDQERVAILDHSSDQFYEVWIGAARANLALTPEHPSFRPGNRPHTRGLPSSRSVCWPCFRKAGRRDQDRAGLHRSLHRDGRGVLRLARPAGRQHL